MSGADPHGTARLLRWGAPAGQARLGLVLLHGRGGSAEDILGLAAHLGLADIAAVAPQAAGHSWWPTSFLAPTAALEPYLSSALAAVGRSVAALEAEGIPRAQIAIAGFSQGGCLAVEAAARLAGPLHAVIALSGAMIGSGDADGAPTDALYGHAPKRFDYETRLDGVPVYLGCHAQDPHIPLARVNESARVLRGLGAEVDEQIFPGPGHGILPEEIRAMQGLLGPSS
ncbi:phospholipase [Halovulum dunhuangense]|uniref:Phospholipase n=1 Tax=Halovulum dunhuangense TaxID=1505036 RepID=A0A849L6F1_9RHOB|nr:dienelactone hydrolase family protein [Halovulum dunhuangense]NNU81690.1 phospholipase [Halovulum dunhuangense]